MSRRIGTKEAKGEYTTFLDGDDYLDSDYIDTLYNLASEHNADIVSSSIKVIDAGETVGIYQHHDDKVMTPQEFFKSVTLDNNTVSAYLNTKLIRRSIWDVVDYSARRYVEDTQTSFFVLSNSNIVVTTRYAGYNYVQNEQSLCHQAGDIKDKIYKALCAKDILEYVDNHKPEDHNPAASAFIARVSQVRSIEFTDEIRQTYKDELSELFVTLLQVLHFKA